MGTLKDNGVKLDPSVYATDTDVPSSFTLGGTYCSFLKLIGIPTLGAQTPRPKQGGPPGSITATRRPPSMGGVSATPSSVEIARIRMNDSRMLIDRNEIEIHKKFALAVACFVFVLLGAPIALRFPRGGVGLTIGVSLVVFSLYYIGLTAGSAAASQGLLPPVVAMWAADVIFGVAGILLLMRMGNEATTARGGDMREALTNLRSWLIRTLRVSRILPERRVSE
jgi:lipopolysaccharide export system permease protein